MKTITIKDIVATARGTEILLPLLNGETSITEWAQSIALDSVTTKNGREISAARSALNGAQFAMTNVAMALRSATELGKVPYTRAVQETNRIYNMLDGLRSAFAGVRNEAHRELTVAEVTLAVKDGVFDELQSTSDAYTREELEELAREGSLSWESIDEIMDMQEAKQATGQADMMDSDGSWSESEGEFRTSVHTASQLWDMELVDIKYSESSAASVALIGMQWPVNNPLWDALLDRLADSWEAGIEYADDKEAAAKKVERREAVIEDLHAKPMMARWVINHVTRRVFRDQAMLAIRAEEISDRLAHLERQAMNEERYGVPASLTRMGTGEESEYDRKSFLYYAELLEAEAAGKAIHDTQIERERSWATAQLETIESLLHGLKSLYTELRMMDLELFKLWELFATDTMPAQPPVYWNKQGPIFDEADALAAIRVEAAMAKQRMREAEGDALVKAAALVEAMLGL
ncbi:hypothetical protein NL64_06265 [Pseudomonas fluorescens]|uniref:hypothetical protein n=1 Tax=Pseudomonas fluorescens TaxID=294 RepID=UPI00054AFC6C|nr:hypothetical protein [Pseudomonas fluorescens]KII34863.1 hypothetical protein NL64_06265 [Pseudomonas fluorescens]